MTLNAFESQESRFKQLRATLEEAKTTAELSAKSTGTGARSSLVISSKALADSLVN